MKLPKLPTFIDDCPADQYHARDWLPEPSLSSSGARLLEAECPAAFHWQYLDPACEPERKRAFDIGNAAHLLVLEDHLFDRQIVVIPCDDYRTKDAREAREYAYENGKVPLLGHEAEMVLAMREALHAHPVARHAFAGGVAERCYLWRDEETGVLCRARLDYTPANLRHLRDLKTSTSANPRTFERRMWDLGYDQQAAWYVEAVEAVTGVRPAEFSFVVIATKKPHLVSVVTLDEETLAWGRLQNQRARRTFAECLRAGRWPGYRDPDAPDRDSAITVRLPPWAKAELQRQHEAGRFTEDSYERRIAEGAHPFA